MDSLPLAITDVFPAEEVDKDEMGNLTSAVLETAGTISSELGVSTRHRILTKHETVAYSL
ncbi:MAG: hypothetical protein NTU93_01940 [Arthrobacter sp.]|nr:hypothetical protein [Arthrobacter sp.]